MKRLDRRESIRFIDLANPQATCPVDKQQLLARFHAEENGQVVSGAAAFAAMWRHIPLLRPMGLLARNQMILKGLERLYLQFLRFRPRLQKLFKKPVFK